MPVASLLNTRMGRALMAPIVRAYQNSVVKQLRKYGQRTGKQRATDALPPAHRDRSALGSEDACSVHGMSDRSQEDAQEPARHPSAMPLATCPCAVPSASPLTLFRCFFSFCFVCPSPRLAPPLLCFLSFRPAGLRSEDMIRVEEMGTVGKQALALMPEHAQQARLRRLIVSHTTTHR